MLPTRCPAPLPLQPVLSLKARVAQVQMLQPGERAGYDLRFTARRETRLAVLSIGYADGLPRSLSCGVGAVLAPWLSCARRGPHLYGPDSGGRHGDP